MLTCALGGHEPREPVISPFGHVFDRSVILEWLKTNTHCPITGQSLSFDQLIAIVAPTRALNPTNLPDLLGGVSAEFARLMEERWNLQTALQTTREQLGVALFRVDAATRVIARLTRERDDLLQRGLNSVVAESQLSRTLPASLAQKTEELAQQLMEIRREAAKTRKTLAPGREKVAGFAEISDLSIDVMRLVNKDQLLAATGKDGHVRVLRLPDGNGGLDLADCIELGVIERKIATVALGESEILFTGDEEGFVQSWRGEEISRFTVGEAAVSVSVHPSGKMVLVATCSRLVLVEVNEEGRLGHAIVEYRGLQGKVSCAAFHPDGLLLGVALEMSTEIATIALFDVRSGDLVKELQGHNAHIDNFRFAENAYMLLSCDSVGRVILWDIRKSAVIADLSVANSTHPVSVAMDESCQYIATATGRDFRLFAFVGKTEVAKIAAFETRQPVSDLQWLAGNRGLVLACADGHLSLVAST